ncbi:MAG: hypothetical protein R3C11_11085 [Planctomycetaceae bacterium]
MARYTLISGVIPALPLILTCPFLCRNHPRAQKKEVGPLKRPSLKELFSDKYRRTTIVTTIIPACSYGAAFGALQQTPRTVPNLPQVKEMTADKTGSLRTEKNRTDHTCRPGELLSGKNRWPGRSLSPRRAGDFIISRRWLIRMFLFPGLIIVNSHLLLPSPVRISIS